MFVFVLTLSDISEFGIVDTFLICISDFFLIEGEATIISSPSYIIFFSKQLSTKMPAEYRGNLKETLQEISQVTSQKFMQNEIVSAWKLVAETYPLLTLTLLDMEVTLSSGTFIRELTLLLRLVQGI